MTFQAIILSLASSVIGGLVVALANHWMTKRRELDKKLVDIRVEHLVSCWTKIERASVVNHDVIASDEKKQRYDDLEAAVARIMLLGDSREIEAARSLAVELSKGAGASTNELLNALRDSLRRQFRLEPVAGMDVFFRMRREK
jgi:hypothetical protein